MFVEPVDTDRNLFRIRAVVSEDLKQKILTTDWINLPYSSQPGQETWPRRLVDNNSLYWYDQWQQEINAVWPLLEQALDQQLAPCFGTAFWIDLPGFTCAIHTDGEMPGSLHLSWIGSQNLGTTFFNSKNNNDIRYQIDFEPNAGYAMINLPDTLGYRLLQWHGMLNPVPDTSYRVTSYTWLYPRK